MKIRALPPHDSRILGISMCCSEEKWANRQQRLIRLVVVCIFCSPCHEIHFQLDEVTSSLLWLDWVNRYHHFPHTCMHAHGVCFSHFLCLFFLPWQCPKIPLKPISGINFTYSKFIILWWIEKRRRWGRRGGQWKEQGNLNGVLRGELNLASPFRLFVCPSLFCSFFIWCVYLSLLLPVSFPLAFDLFGSHFCHSALSNLVNQPQRTWQIIDNSQQQSQSFIINVPL